MRNCRPSDGIADRRTYGPGITERLAHRGPDDQGVWLDPERRVGLEDRRFSIVDLSPAGHQPMESSDGRWVVVYKGEIYNHAELSNSTSALWSILMFKAWLREAAAS